jgi:hypothetical protein
LVAGELLVWSAGEQGTSEALELANLLEKKTGGLRT